MNLPLSSLGILVCLAIAGCGGDDPASPDFTGPRVTITYDSAPLADVQIRLHATQSGSSLAYAVSAADGIARFPQLPVPEPTEYFVSLESIGDGGWILDQKFTTTSTSGIRLKPLVDNASQQIALPRGAVRPLYRVTR